MKRILLKLFLYSLYKVEEGEMGDLENSRNWNKKSQSFLFLLVQMGSDWRSEYEDSGGTEGGVFTVAKLMRESGIEFKKEKEGRRRETRFKRVLRQWISH